MDQSRENERVMYSIQNGARMFSMFVFADGRMALKIYQTIQRLHHAHQLSKGEVKNFETFMKITKGKYDIVNVPGRIQKFQEELKRSGIRFCMMPDLNKTDGMTQIAVFTEDRQKFQALFEKHIERELRGGEKNLSDLSKLTNNNVSIIDIPCEGAEQAVFRDLDALKVNYAKLPDLKVGDGSVQLMVANADLDKVEHWFAKYKEKMENISDYKAMRKEDYFSMARMTEKEYMETADEKTKQILESFNEKKMRKELETAAETVKNMDYGIRKQSIPRFSQLKENPEFQMISINHHTLVSQEPVAVKFMKENPEWCVSRIPGTWGDKKQFLVLPSDQVFKTPAGQWVAFLEKEKTQLTLNSKGNIERIENRKKGSELVKHYNKVYKQVQDMAAKQEKSIAKDLLEKIPANPIKAK